MVGGAQRGKERNRAALSSGAMVVGSTHQTAGSCELGWWRGPEGPLGGSRCGGVICGAVNGIEQRSSWDLHLTDAQGTTSNDLIKPRPQAETLVLPETVQPSDEAQQLAGLSFAV